MGLRREIRRLKARHLSSVRFRGLSVPLKRSGMNEDVAMLLVRGSYEAPEIAGVEAVVREGDRVLEVGAGLGIVTALAARRVGKGRLRAYEANPELVDDTRSFLAAAGIDNAEIVNAVLVPDRGGAGVPESRRFHLAPSFAEGSLRADGATDGRTISVPAEPLSEVIASFRPDVLICDIEGAEAELIPAFDASSLRAAVIELHPHQLTRAEVAAIYDHLAGHGLYPMIEHSSGTVVVFERVT